MFLRIYEENKAVIDHPVFFWSRNDEFKTTAQDFKIDYNGYLGGYQKANETVTFGIVVKATSATQTRTEEVANLISTLNAIRAGQLSKFKLNDKTASEDDGVKVEDVNSVVDYEAFRKHYEDIDARLGSFKSEYDLDKRWTLSRSNSFHYSEVLFNFDEMQSQTGLPPLAIKIELEYVESLLKDESVGNVPNTKIYVGGTSVNSMNQFIRTDPKTENEWNNLGASPENLSRACKEANTVLKAQLQPVDQFIAISSLLHERATEVKRIGWTKEIEASCFAPADLLSVKNDFSDVYAKYSFPLTIAKPSDLPLYTAKDRTLGNKKYKNSKAKKEDVVEYVNSLLKQSAQGQLNIQNELLANALITAVDEHLFAGQAGSFEICDRNSAIRKRSFFDGVCEKYTSSEFLRLLQREPVALGNDKKGELVGTGCYFHFRPQVIGAQASGFSDGKGNVATPNRIVSLAYLKGELTQIDWVFQNYKGDPVLAKATFTPAGPDEEMFFKNNKGAGCGDNFERIIYARNNGSDQVVADAGSQ